MKTITDGSLNIEQWSHPPNICTDSLSVFIHSLFFFLFHLCLGGLPGHFGRGRGDAEDQEKDGEMENEKEDRRREKAGGTG